MNELQMQYDLIRFGMNAAIVVLVFYSIILHEISHALVSSWLGDDTAKRMGRLSLNPLKHIDWFGTVILPLIFYFTMRVVYGYAKPVQLNPYNYRNYKRDTGLTALAGPVTNFLIAIFFALVFHLNPGKALIQNVCFYTVFFNLLLGFFNLIPIPPLDGSKVLGIFLPDQLYFRWTAQERKGMMILFAIVMISSLLNLNLIGRVVLRPISFVMQLLGLG